MRVVDAAAAAINEGNIDFLKRKTTDPSNAASRFARHIRMRASSLENEGIYLEKGKKILAMGLRFNYIDDASEGKTIWRSVMLGSSTIGENVTHTFSNHEIGAKSKIKLPRGDWSEVFNGIIFTFVLAASIIYFPALRIWVEMAATGNSNKLLRVRSLFIFGVLAVMLYSIYSIAMDENILEKME